MFLRYHCLLCFLFLALSSRLVASPEGLTNDDISSTTAASHDIVAALDEVRASLDHVFSSFTTFLELSMSERINVKVFNIHKRDLETAATASVSIRTGLEETWRKLNDVCELYGRKGRSQKELADGRLLAASFGRAVRYAAVYDQLRATFLAYGYKNGSAIVGTPRVPILEERATEPAQPPMFAWSQDLHDILSKALSESLQTGCASFSLARLTYDEKLAGKAKHRSWGRMHHGTGKLYFLGKIDASKEDIVASVSTLFSSMVHCKATLVEARALAQLVQPDFMVDDQIRVLDGNYRYLYNDLARTAVTLKGNAPSFFLLPVAEHF